MSSIPCALCGSTGATVRAIDPHAPCCEDGALTAEQFTAAHVQQPKLTVSQRVRSIACPYLTGTVLAVASHSLLINWDMYADRTDGCKWEADDLEVA